MNGLSTREQKQALNHRTGEAAAPSYQSLSCGPVAVYPSHTPPFTTTEELQPILTADLYLYCSVTLLPQEASVKAGYWRQASSGCACDRCKFLYSIVMQYNPVDWTYSLEIETGCFQLQSREDGKNERMFTNPIISTSLIPRAQDR